MLEFGIEVVDDLQDLFADKSLLQKCKAVMTPEDFPRFVKAFQKYKIDMQDDDFAVTKAEISSQVASSSKNERDEKEVKKIRRIAGELSLYRIFTHCTLTSWHF